MGLSNIGVSALDLKYVQGGLMRVPLYMSFIQIVVQS